MTCAAQDVEDIHNVLSIMQKNLECPICLDLMKEPVATRCDHIFCRFCMLQLLSKKKKGRAPCPMCKKEITKRSLQESPRFKLLIDGLMKIINAFELDSGYKFFPSQEYSKNITVNCKESQEEDDVAVVQSVGYRNRNKLSTVSGGRCLDHPTLLDTELAGDTGTQSRRPKRQKKKTRQLIAEFVSDSSEDDLFKKAGSLGDDDGPYLECVSKEATEPENGEEDSLKIGNANDQFSSKSEVEDVGASDLAEYGFSERDLESTRSHLLCMDGTPKELSNEMRSTESRNCLIFNATNWEKKAELNRQANLAKNETNCEHTGSKDPGKTNMQLEQHLHNNSQMLKMSIDYQYEELSSTQESPGDLICAVSKKRMKRSVQRVNEWLLKTTELLNYSLWDEDLLSEVFPVAEQNDSDIVSCNSDETEIMATVHPCVVQNALEKSNVEDKVFGKVYKRERKSNSGLKVTCVADVHVDNVTETLKIKETPNVPSVKRKRNTSSLQPEDFIKRVEEKVSDCLLAPDKNKLGISNCRSLDCDHIEAYMQDLKTISDDQETKPKKQKKSLKKKSGKLQGTRTMQSLSLVGRADLISCKQQTPCNSSELEIDSFHSSNVPGHEVIQKNVRRSRRLKSLPEKVLPYSANLIPTQTNDAEMNLVIKDLELHNVDLSNKTSNLRSPETESKGINTQITTISPPNIKAIQNVTNTEIECSHSESSVHLTNNGCEDPWHTPAKAVENVLNNGEMEDSDIDTQHLLMTFKSAKRMSFKLDVVTETTGKDNFDLGNISNIPTNVTNGHQLILGKEIGNNTDNLCNGKSLSKSNIQEENIQPQSKGPSLLATKPGNTNKLHLRSKKKCDFSSSENMDSTTVHETKTVAVSGQLNDFTPVKETDLHEENNQRQNAAVSKHEGLQLLSDTESMRSHPAITHESPASVRRGNPKSRANKAEREQARNSYQKDSFAEEQVNQTTSAIGSQDSMANSIPCHPASCNSSPCKSPQVNSATPDGLLGSATRLGEVTRCCVVTEKSFVFDGTKSALRGSPETPVSHSQLLTRRKRQAQKLETSSSEESSGDEELPCFNALLSNTTSTAAQKNASIGSSPKQQGGGVLALFSSCSTSGKTHTSWNLLQEPFLLSQESQCSVNLFSSQSNTSDHSVNGAADHKYISNQNKTQESTTGRAMKQRTVSNESEQMVHVENDLEEPSHEPNLGEISGCESEASHTGDSSGLSSQCEILNTQQRDAMHNNLEKLQREMAALEAVLEQHGTQSPVSEGEQASSAEHVSVRPQDAWQKQTDLGVNTSTNPIAETKVQNRLSGMQNVEPPVHFEMRSRSPTPPPIPPQTKPRRESSEKVSFPFNVFKELKEPDLTDGESVNVELSSGPSPKNQDPDPCTSSLTIHNHAKATPKPSLRRTPLSQRVVTNRFTPRIESLRPLGEPRELVQQQMGSTQRSSSPTFASPARSRISLSAKSPVVSNRRNFSIVASGLNQSELILVQKFARKTQSVFSNQMTVSTTHVIMKTDEFLVCERTLKYFLGIAGRKWVVSYEYLQLHRKQLLQKNPYSYSQHTSPYLLNAHSAPSLNLPQHQQTATAAEKQQTEPLV
ncbi:breast cancer type 1 susceptibility protein isoform X2 [Pseudophryne corroboree]|uniref:breast cancer type 1 susceptibility protein isoform X2 n=1 Tax=Pseudophryne corroboree TaxID=495146 RepID=UPI0030820D2D